MPDISRSEHQVDRDRPRLNEQYVRRGEVVLDLSFLTSWKNEPEEMNLNKRGRPFTYPRSFLKCITSVRDVWHLTFREAEGFLHVRGSVLGFKAPDYTTLWRREVEEDLDDLVVPNAKGHVPALDSTGLSISPRGEWIAHKYRVPRDFVKLHAAADVATNAAATGGHKGDAAQLPGLVKQAEERLVGHVVEMQADGGYDARENFDFLREKEVETVIHMRKNANMKRMGGSAARPPAVQERNFLGEEYRRYVKRYGHR